MSDRLDELKRQRALVAGHLQWLDQEIASTEAAISAPFLQTSSIPTLLPRPAPDLPSPIPADVDAAMAQMQEEERRNSEISKSGCWLIFAGLLLLVVGGITTFILLKYQ